jgi:hypothetical protein
VTRRFRPCHQVPAPRIALIKFIGTDLLLTLERKLETSTGFVFFVAHSAVVLLLGLR